MSDETIVGKVINRQGASKKKSELNDIENAMNILAEKNQLPLFVASSCMVMQTPIHDGSSPALRDFTEIVESTINKHVIQLVKKCDQSISKTDYGNKKIDEVLNKMNPTIQYHPTMRPMRPMRPMQTYTVKEQSEDASTLNPVVYTTETKTQINSNQRDYSETWGIDPKLNKNNIISTPHSWAAVVAHSLPKDKMAFEDDRKGQFDKRNWKTDLHVLDGTGLSQNTTIIKPKQYREKSIVAYNIRKDITTANLRDWLTNKGLHVKDCNLLTKSNQAR